MVLSSLAGAQQAAPPQTEAVQQTEGPPIRVLVEEVTVPFTVTDGKNRLITDLSQEDFQVLEEKEAQPVTAFLRETDVPLRIGLLIDTSASIRDRFEFEQRAASDFLRALLRQGKDKAFLASFDSIAELIQDFTDDLDALVNAIESLRPGGGTSLYDAVYYGSREKLLEDAPSLGSLGNYRRTIVILSDGEDNQSRFSRLQALEMAERAEVTIYTISTNIQGLRMPGDKVLREFAEYTGGRFFQPRTWNDLDDAFREINTELRSQYSLSYRPSSARDGKFHAIEIVPAKKGLRVRARRGYYATKPPGQMPPSESSVIAK